MKRYQLPKLKFEREGDVMSTSTRDALAAAERFGIKWRMVPGTEIFELTYGSLVRYFWHQIPASTSSLASTITCNKNFTNAMLRDKGISTSSFRYFDRTTFQLEEAVRQISEMRPPFVVKPSIGSHGNSVRLEIPTPDEAAQAVQEIFSEISSERNVIVEEMFQGGKEYRILLTRDKVVAVMHRVPANVVGDGVSTIKKLIDQKNLEPNRGSKGHWPMSVIVVDDDLLGNLSEQSLSLETVLEKGRKIFLRKVSNLSKGGDGIDMTDDIHPSVADISLRAIQAIPGLTFAGLDFMTTDVTAQQTPDSYVVIEVNNSPGFNCHDYPTVGESRHTAEVFVGLLFPELDLGV